MECPGRRPACDAAGLFKEPQQYPQVVVLFPTHFFVQHLESLCIDLCLHIFQDSSGLQILFEGCMAQKGSECTEVKDGVSTVPPLT